MGRGKNTSPRIFISPSQQTDVTLLIKPHATLAQKQTKGAIKRSATWALGCDRCDFSHFLSGECCICQMSSLIFAGVPCRILTSTYVLGIKKGLSAPMPDRPRFLFNGAWKKWEIYEVGMYSSIELSSSKSRGQDETDDAKMKMTVLLGSKRRTRLLML